MIVPPEGLSQMATALIILTSVLLMCVLISWLASVPPGEKRATHEEAGTDHDRIHPDACPGGTWVAPGSVHIGQDGEEGLTDDATPLEQAFIEHESPPRRQR